MGKGYQLEMTEPSLFRIYLQSLSMDGAKKPAFIPKLPQERITSLIKRLLLHDTYIKMDDIADEIYVSTSTIQNAFIDVKNIVAEYEIVVESQRNYVLQLIVRVL